MIPRVAPPSGTINCQFCTYTPSRSSSPPRSMSDSSISSSVLSDSNSSRAGAGAAPVAPPSFAASAATGAALRRAAVEDFRLAPLRLALRFAALFRAALLRALVLREALPRERAVRFALRAALALRLRDFGLRLPLLFFLPRGGILLLCEPGSTLGGRVQGARGRKSLPPERFRRECIRDRARRDDEKIQTAAAGTRHPAHAEREAARAAASARGCTGGAARTWRGTTAQSAEAAAGPRCSWK